MNRKLMYAVPALLIGGAALTGGLVWAADHHANRPAQAGASPPKLVLNEQPLHREANFAGSFASVVKKVSPSVVRVKTMTKARLTSNEGMPSEMQNMPFFRRFFGQEFRGAFPNQPMQMPQQRGEGSGVIVSKDGYILTNNHVVDHADEVMVYLHDGREFTAKVVGKDPKSDLAVIKVEAQNLPVAEVADSDKVEVGDVVLAIGNQFGIGQSVPMGIVSATGRATLGLDYEDFIQTDAAINPGNSGGALVDTEGRLIGINTAILSHSGGNQGIGFAIPAHLASRVMTSLVKNGHVVRGYLGVSIQDVTPTLAKEFKLGKPQGALVADVSPNSPASRAGLASGDVIVEFNGKPVADSRHLKLQVAETKPGESVMVKFERNGQARNLQVKIAELPGEPAMLNASHHAAENTDALNGVGVTDLKAKDRQEFNMPEKTQGALITSVEENSPAAEAGLKPGDVILEINRQPVKSAAEAVRLTEHPKDRVTLVRVWSHGATRYVVVDETIRF
ncbi:MAG: DegQ family serine endoprotease [Verrucomicrobia bacterium]|nr:DegQ family serine endoprotease [Verrucomicrobiota bacterium]